MGKKARVPIVNSPYVTEKLEAVRKLVELNEPFFEAIKKHTPWTLVDRAAWGAVPPVKECVATEEPATRMVLTYRTSPAIPCHTQNECKPLIKRIQQNHFRRGMSDIGYNFLIGGDGSVYEGRGWGVRSSLMLRHPHTPNKESDHRIDVAFIGDHDPETISLKMFTSALNVVHIGSKKNYVVRQWLVDSIPRPKYNKEKFVKRDNRVRREKINLMGEIVMNKRTKRMLSEL